MSIYLQNPSEEKKYRFVLQVHTRGRSVSDLTPVILRKNDIISVVPLSHLFKTTEQSLLEKPLNNCEVWGENGFEKAKWVMRHRLNDANLLRINCRSGSIDVTDEHSLFFNKKPIAAGNLEVGSQIDLLELPHLSGNLHPSADYAWTMGFFAAEGSKSDEKGKTAKFDTTTPELFERPQNMCKTLGIPFHTWSFQVEGFKKAFCMGISGLGIWNQFYCQAPHLFKQRKARLKIVPSFVFNWVPEAQENFLDGFLAGDGDNQKKTFQFQKYNFSSSSAALSQGLILLAHNVIPEAELSIRLQDDLFRIRFVKANHNLTSNSREIKKILKARKSASHIGKTNPNYKNGSHVKKHLVQKQQFQYSSRRYVYDIETDSHSFLSGIGQIKAHNSVHLDFRYELDVGTVLLGFTIDAIKSLSRTSESLADAKKLAEEKMPIFIKKIHDPTTKWVVQTKQKEPHEWLTIDNQTFKPGTIGATKNEFGYMWIIDKGIVEYGTQKAAFNELFCHGTKKWKGQTIWDGRLVIRALPNIWRKKSLETGEPEKTGRGYLVHMAFFADPEPYTLSHRALQKKWYPPAGISALPKKIKTQIPSEYQYWKIKEQSKAHELRDELIRSIKKKEVILKYAEDEYIDEFITEEFAKKKKHVTRLKRKPKKPEKKEPERKVTIDKIKTPSSSVRKKIQSVLLYDPPKELKFWWDPGRGSYAGRTKKGTIKWSHCPDCIWLAENSPWTIDTLPTYPGEGKIQCRGKDLPKLQVNFPHGVHYDFLPVKDKAFYKSDWLRNWKTEEFAKEHGDETFTPLRITVLNELKKMKDGFASLIVDFKNMDKVDKFFMVFAGAPLIKDMLVTYKQATKEILATMSPEEIESLYRFKQGEIKNRFDKRVEAVWIRILNEGQLKEIEEQLPLWEDFFLEFVTADMVKPITMYTFRALARGLKGLKKFTDAPAVGRIIKACFTEADAKRTALMVEKIKEAKANATTFMTKLNYWGLKIGKDILDEIDYFVSFWKDCVLIYAPGVPVRNMADNTLKAVNEMINSFTRGSVFWPFMRKGGKAIIPVPKEVSKGFFVKAIAELDDTPYSWYQKFRSFLYDSFLGRPEQKAREWFFAGKISMYAKKLLKAGKNLDDFYDIMKAKGIREVNRVFFDYEKRMAIEIPIGRIAPFFTFNIRNANYWFKDFMYRPWKMGFIRGVWEWWGRRTGQWEFKIRDMVPAYLIPGVYFDPLQWTSALKFIELFTKYKGEQKWFETREAHLKFHSKILNSLPPEARTRIYSRAKIKDMHDYENRQKFIWRKMTVAYIDRFIGIFPAWKKVLVYLNQAEKEPWRTMFPQSQLLDVVTSVMYNDFCRSIKPPSTTTLRYLYGILDKQGIPTKEEIDREIEKITAKLSSEDRATRERTMTWEIEKRERDEVRKELRKTTAREIYKLWQVQKTITAYLTGMYLCRAWRKIYEMHVAICDELRAKE